MQYWFLGVSFIVGCAFLSGPKLMELGMMEHNARDVESRKEGRASDGGAGKSGSQSPRSNGSPQSRTPPPSGYK